MKVLYIHDHSGSPRDSEFCALEQISSAIAAFRIPSGCASPEEVLNELCRITEKEPPDVVAGKELGGFFAVLLSVRRNLPALLSTVRRICSAASYTNGVKRCCTCCRV